MSGTGPEAAARVTTQAPARAHGYSMSGTGPEAAARVTTQAPANVDREGEGA